MQSGAVVGVLFVVFGCVVPAQTGPQPVGPQPGYAPYGQPTAQVTRASCQQNLQCYGSCSAEACLQACDAQTTPDASAQSRAVLQCAVENQCADGDCIGRACGMQLSQCSGVQPTVAQPQQPPPPQQPQPAANQSVGVPQLVGRWEHAAASNTSFVDVATGAYAGSSVTAYGERYDISADGTIDYLLAGVSGSNRVRSVEKGSVSFANGFMVVTFPTRRVNAVAELRVMSYFTTTDGTTILVTVPARTEQTTVHWEDPAYVANFCGPPGQRIEHCVGGETWIRAR